MVMNWFWKLFGYKSFKPKVGDMIRIEIWNHNYYDAREIIKEYRIEKIVCINYNSNYNMLNCFYTKPYIYHASNNYSFDYYATILYHPKQWGGLKPLSDEDKIELL